MHDPTPVPLLGLDHVGLGIRDLAAAAAAFERLGFTLSPLSMHAGSIAPGTPPVPWGSGNRCAMFENGYIELLGLVDASLPSNVKAMVERYEGLHIVALDCQDADAAHAPLTQAGVAAHRTVALERDASFGPRNDGIRRAKFKNIYLDAVAHPEARFIVIEHETRDVLWQPHLLDHPNGVVALAAVTLAVPDLAAALDRLIPLLGQPVPQGDGYRFALRHGVVHVLAHDAARQAIPVLDGEPVERVAAATFAVRSLPALEAFLSSRGIDFLVGVEHGSGRRCVWVGPRDAAHAALQFIPSF